MKKEDKYLQAQKKVAKQKNFYNHLQVFVIMMIVIIVFSDTIFNFFEEHISNQNTLKWIRTNIWINSLLWAFGLLIHGIYAFKNKISIVENWEKKKIEDIMNEN